MKYSFRLLKTGPKTEISNSWGHPPNLHACPQCETINLKLQTTCIMCGHPMHAEKTPADNVASATAPAASMEGKNFSAGKEFPDILKQPPAMAAASPPAPDMTMANRQFRTFNEQKWLRWAWGLILLLVLVAATGLLVFSLLPSPSASSDAATNTSKANANGMPMPAPAEDARQKAHTPDEGLATPAIAPEPAPHDTRTSTDANVVENRMAQPAAEQEHIRNVPVIPVAPAPPESAAAADARCSGARQALSLCN